MLLVGWSLEIHIRQEGQVKATIDTCAARTSRSLYGAVGEYDVGDPPGTITSADC
jgi:hypothetical protein